MAYGYILSRQSQDRRSAPRREGTLPMWLDEVIGKGRFHDASVFPSGYSL
jgi:hypothetical protein